jgi:hypothetical protein
VPGEEIRIRLYQNMANGAGPAFVALGTLDQDDQQGILAARPVFEWHAKNQDLYVAQENAARVMLVGSHSPAYRGFFRLLSELHIPFAVSDNLDWTKRRREFDLVIAPEQTPAELAAYVQGGGSLLAGGTEPPVNLGLPRMVKRNPQTRGYWRVRDRGSFPSLKNTSLLFLDSDFVEFPPDPNARLTLIPPSIFGPPEKVFTDAVDTQTPGVITGRHGNGRYVYVPWNIGALYYRHSSHAHAGLLADLVDELLVNGRQIRTNAHPLLEMTLMRQRGRMLLHLVNLTGHSGTAYFAPIPMKDIRIEVAEPVSRARAVALGRVIPVHREGKYAVLTLPEVERYEVLILE